MSKNQTQIDKNKPLEMYDFIKQTIPQHLTIADVKKLKVGDTIDVVIWDRNFEESWIWDNATPQQPYRPEIFFQENHQKITYLGNMSWLIRFNWGEDIEHPIHLDVSALQTYWKWCPLEDGYINIVEEIIKEGETLPSHWCPTHKHWTEFPETTRVGWRGPIMLWKYMAQLPAVYYSDKK